MATTYATTDDVIALRGPQSADDLSRLSNILVTISAQFRIEAKNYGKDLDAMIAADPDLLEVTKALVIDASMQYLASSKSSEAPLTQWSQSAGGYSASGTFLNPGGGLYTKKTWLKMLGVSRQRVGSIEIFDIGGCKNAN